VRHRAARLALLPQVRPQVGHAAVGGASGILLPPVSHEPVRFPSAVAIDHRKADQVHEASRQRLQTSPKTNSHLMPLAIAQGLAARPEQKQVAQNEIAIEGRLDIGQNRHGDVKSTQQQAQRKVGLLPQLAERHQQGRRRAVLFLDQGCRLRD
jgi:hypothetical protein